MNITSLARERVARARFPVYFIDWNNIKSLKVVPFVNLYLYKIIDWLLDVAS